MYVTYTIGSGYHTAGACACAGMDQEKELSIDAHYRQQVIPVYKPIARTATIFLRTGFKDRRRKEKT